jgi:hypothetical protein
MVEACQRPVAQSGQAMASFGVVTLGEALPDLREPVAQAGEAGQADAGMFSLMLVRNHALDYGRVVTCGCPGTREPR